MEDRNAFISANEALVGSVVIRHLGRGVSYDELRSEGMAALIWAVDNFKPELGEWGPHATATISRWLLNLIEKIQRQLNREAGSIDYVNVEVEIKAEPVETGLENEELWQQVGRYVNAKEAKAITLVFKEGLTCEQAGQKMDVTKGRISQLVKSGVEKIKTTGALADWRQK